MTSLVTAANAPYMPRITPYLHTIQAHSRFDRNVLITVGCKVEMPAELAGIQTIPLPAAQALGHTGNFCIQQGCFLDVLGAADDDVLIFTDGDIALQRPPSADELSYLGAIPQGTIALAWNCGPHDTLQFEADRLELSAAGREQFGGLLHLKVWNVGVIVCRAATYRRIYDRYMERWPVFAPETGHYARNQFLMCAVVHELGLPVWELSPAIHAHGHWTELPYGCEDRDGELWYQGERVLFRHYYGC